MPSFYLGGQKVGGTYSKVTQTKDGLMSKEDKLKLDGIDDANVIIVTQAEYDTLKANNQLEDKLYYISDAEPDDAYGFVRKPELTTIKADLQNHETRITDLEESGGGGAVNDVQINGTSILDSNKNANIVTGNGITFDSNGRIQVNSAGPSWLSSRNSTSFVSAYQIDNATRLAMCDGKGAEWTDEEKASARERIGIDEWTEIADITLTEDSILEVDFGKKYKYVFLIGSPIAYISGTSAIFLNGSTNLAHSLGIMPMDTSLPTDTKKYSALIEASNNFVRSFCINNTNIYSTSNVVGTTNNLFTDGYISKIKTARTLLSGSHVMIYGKDEVL